MVRATVWDVIPYLYFVDGECPTPYGTRFESLCLLADKHQPTKVGLVDSWEVENYEEAKTLFEGLLADGQEGIILKDKRGIWENKRAKHQIKFKGEMECDLEIIAVEEGTGKNAGRTGALVCSGSDDGRDITVNVGSGFSDSDRDDYWHNSNHIIGRTAEILCDVITCNMDGTYSLRFPRFVRFRDDK